MKFDLSTYDFELPEANIAQIPSVNRDESRLLLVDCRNRSFSHHTFSYLSELLQADDLLVLNDTRVFPARLLGKKESGGKVELLLLHYPEHLVDTPSPLASDKPRHTTVKGLIKSSKRPKPGSKLYFSAELEGVVLSVEDDGSATVLLAWQGDFDDTLARFGQVPLPPYISRESGPSATDTARYQTVYARNNGAIAAPTAGLHFTDTLLERIQAKGTGIAKVTLHVGYGTFAPVRTIDIREHKIHSEHVRLDREMARRINHSKERGGKIWAVGTTTTRALEFAAASGLVRPQNGPCDLYIYPGYQFQAVDRMITNFHLPKSSLLFMVSAFADGELIMAAYQEALQQDYRFYSYGDAMIIIK